MGRLHSLALPHQIHKSEQGQPGRMVLLHARGHFSKHWIQSGLWEKGLSLGTDHGYLVSQQVVNPEGVNWHFRNGPKRTPGATPLPAAAPPSRATAATFIEGLLHILVCKCSRKTGAITSTKL